MSRIVKFLRPLLTTSSALAIPQIFMMAYALIVARWLSPDLYGVMSACYAAATLFAFFLNWGIDSWMLRQAAIDRQPFHLLGEVILFKLAVGFLWSLVLWNVLRLFQPDLFQAPILAITILDVLFDSVFNSFLVVWMAAERIRLAFSLLIASRALRLLSALVLIFISIQGLLVFSLVRFASTLFILFIAWLIVRPPVKGITIAPLVSIFKNAFPYSASDFLTLVYAQADVNLLSLFTGDRAMIGNFSVVISLANAILTIPSGVYSIWLPKIIHQRTGNSARYIHAVIELFASLLITGGALTLFVALFGREIANLTLGPAYTGTAALMVIISPIFFLKCLNLANTALLIAGDLQRERLLPQVLSVIFKIAAGVAIIPLFQAVGMVWVGIFSEVVLLLGYVYKVIRQRRGVFTVPQGEEAVVKG